MSYGLVQHMKITEELKQRFPRNGRVSGGSNANDTGAGAGDCQVSGSRTSSPAPLLLEDKKWIDNLDRDQVALLVSVHGIKDEFFVICEMEVDEAWQGDDGKHPASASVKFASTLQGIPFPLTREQEEEAIRDFWAKQEAE